MTSVRALLGTYPVTISGSFTPSLSLLRTLGFEMGSGDAGGLRGGNSTRAGASGRGETVG